LCNATPSVTAQLKEIVSLTPAGSVALPVMAIAGPSTRGVPIETILEVGDMLPTVIVEQASRNDQGWHIS